MGGSGNAWRYPRTCMAHLESDRMLCVRIRRLDRRGDPEGRAEARPSDDDVSDWTSVDGKVFTTLPELDSAWSLSRSVIDPRPCAMNRKAVIATMNSTGGKGSEGSGPAGSGAGAGCPKDQAQATAQRSSHQPTTALGRGGRVREGLVVADGISVSKVIKPIVGNVRTNEHLCAPGRSHRDRPRRGLAVRSHGGRWRNTAGHMLDHASGAGRGVVLPSPRPGQRSAKIDERHDRVPTSAR